LEEASKAVVADVEAKTQTDLEINSNLLSETTNSDPHFLLLLPSATSNNRVDSRVILEEAISKTARRLINPTIFSSNIDC
jgi:hypothetical protein